MIICVALLQCSNFLSNLSTPYYTYLMNNYEFPRSNALTSIIEIKIIFKKFTFIHYTNKRRRKICTYMDHKRHKQDEASPWLFGKDSNFLN